MQEACLSDLKTAPENQRCLVDIRTTAWKPAALEPDSRSWLAVMDESCGILNPPPGVEVDGVRTVPATCVVLALGPWSNDSASWGGADSARPLLPTIGATKYHSISLRPAVPVTNHMIFTDYRFRSGGGDRAFV